MPSAQRKYPVGPGVLIASLAVLIGMGFALATRHVWEDYWITFRASKNLATGQGLVFTPGERLHTFTSPLGVLLPAAFSYLTGNQSDAAALWLFRSVSVGAFAAGLVLLLRVFGELRLKRVSCWLALGLIGLDTKIVDFTINGMEIGLLFFFAALVLHGLLVVGPRQVLRLGAGAAGLMWTRPDSCVYIAALAVASVAFLPRGAEAVSHRDQIRKLMAAGLVCTVLYLPWFLWAWSYYGTPIPHTITAKGAVQPPFHALQLAQDLLTFPARVLVPGGTSITLTFLPVYANFGGWWPGYELIASLLAAMAALAWLLPGQRPETRLLSFVYFLGSFYLTHILKYYPPWYLPLPALFGYLTLGMLFDRALDAAEKSRPNGRYASGLARFARALRLAVPVLIAGQLAATVCSARQLGLQQALIEDGMRQPIGLWLRAHARTSRDSVMLEPLGYIGYYSGLRMLDYPGLASKEMVAARKRLGAARQNQAYRELKPDWLVLRPLEADLGTYVEQAGLRKYYELVKEFDAREKIEAIHWLPGRPYLLFDQKFLIFHRKPDSVPGSAE